MNANLNGYYNEIESTASKKDELLELLKNYTVTAHTNEGTNLTTLKTTT